MENQNSSSQVALIKTPLLELHQSYNAKMVDFAGFFMPLQYEGIVAEHNHTRNQCSLFDVSHMGQAWILGNTLLDTVHALQQVVPANLMDLAEGKMVYSTLLNEEGGIVDDLIITRMPSEGEQYIVNGQRAYFHVVVNASRKEVDYAYFNDVFASFKGVLLHPLEHLALIAVQGPKTIETLQKINPSIDNMNFMTAAELELAGIRCWVSRSGYTGEAGFEIATESQNITKLCELLLSYETIKLAGLGARDSLRLEAGLPLYGNDMDENRTPVEANLNFVLSKKRLESADFKGAKRILQQLEDGVDTLRVGLEIEGRAPVRQGAIIMVGEEEVGVVTSGCFSPVLQKPIAFASIKTDFINRDNLVAVVRKKAVPVKIGKLVFVPTRYK